MDNNVEKALEEIVEQSSEQIVETGKKKKTPVAPGEEYKDLINQIAEAKKNKDWKTAFNLTGRLINKLKSKINKLQSNKKTANNPEYIQLVAQAKALLNDNRKNYRSLYKNCLKNTKKYANDLGKIRKTYISYVEKEIKRLSKMENLDTDDQKYLNELKNEHPVLLSEYKQNLNDRYISTLMDTNPNLINLLIALPKACVIAIKKIIACIKDVKYAKDEKDKVQKIVDVVKSSGLLLASPVLFAGRFAIDAVLCVVFGTSLKLTGKALNDFITRVKDKLGLNGKNDPQIENNLTQETSETTLIR